MGCLVWRKLTCQQPPSPNDPYATGSNPPRWPEPPLHFASAWIGAFVGIATATALVYQTSLNAWNFPPELAQFLLASMGASSVLLYGAPQAALTQPYNVFVGGLGSTCIGITCRIMLPAVEWRWLSAALAVSLSIVMMMLTNSVYPPAGASALSAATLAQLPTGWGYSFLLSPVLLDMTLLFGIALLSNNLVPTRHYPDRWWPQRSTK